MDIGCTSVNTQQGLSPLPLGVHGISNRKCQLEAVE